MLIYIYSLLDPVTFEIRYIGKTCNINSRYKKHLRNTTYQITKKYYVYRWVNTLLTKNLQPLLMILEETDEQHWQQAEIDWIKAGKEFGLKLTNTCKGGEGGSGMLGKHHSKKTKERLKKTSTGNTNKLGKKLGENSKLKISLSQIGRPSPMRGKKHSETTKKKISESRKGCKAWNKGIPMSKEQKLKLSIAKKGCIHSDKTKLKMSLSQLGKKLKDEDTKK